MHFFELVNMAVSLIEFGEREQTFNSVKSWIAKDYTLYVTDGAKYNECIEELYKIDKLVSTRFSRKTVYDFLNNRLKEIKLSNEEFKQSKEDFYNSFHSVEPTTLTVRAPISGIRLDNEIRSFNLSVFNFGYLEDLEFPISNEQGMYISTAIENVYDKSIAIQRADNAFINFSRLIIFISGKIDRSIFIETGLPLRPNLTHEHMYIGTSSFQISDENGLVDFGNISTKHVEKVPINSPFFSENKDFGFIWDLYEKKHKELKLNDLESRALNAALALGESASTKDVRNSIIYTCISLEVLFSLDSGSLFQKSIGEKLADIFAFIIAKNKESRLLAGSLIKKVYAMRSAIVHGGDKELSNENLIVNIYMRSAINELFHNEKFKDLTKISQVYESLKHAQNSY